VAPVMVGAEPDFGALRQGALQYMEGCLELSQPKEFRGGERVTLEHRRKVGDR
jgi:hypothetical protein